MNMLQSVKRFWWVLLLVAGVPAARGFSFLTPIVGGNTWEIASIDYNDSIRQFSDLGGVGNIGEEYRRNTPVLYYAYNANFLDFFGSNGVVAGDGAFAMMNAAFTNNPTGATHGVDGYSPELSEFPFYSTSVNYTAQSLGLTDLKSIILGLLVEQMALADPVRYVWTLRERVAGTPCPAAVTYLVIQRNFDILPSPLNSPAAQTQYSSYINDVLYSYYIIENCPPSTPLAETVPFPVDPYAQTYAPVASLPTTFLNYGNFYTGLTRDDVACLRYLLTTNNIHTEDPTTGALLLTTTNVPSTVLTTSNLSALVVASQTNDPTLIPGLFPGVTVTSYSNYWVAVGTPNIISYYLTTYGTPYPAATNLVSVTNGYTTTAEEMYVDTFGGIITSANLTTTPNIFLNGAHVVLDYETSTPASLVTVSQGAPLYGTPYPNTNVVASTNIHAIVVSNTPSGEYFTVPAGQCGWKFVSPQPAGFPFANVISSTNVISTTTNVTTAATNITTVSIVTYFTNHTYVAVPITCVTSTPVAGLYEGIEHIRFVRADYDSLIGQTFHPITNHYTMTLVTNSQTVVQNFQRLVTAPDILLTAADTATAGYAIQRTTPVWD